VPIPGFEQLTPQDTEHAVFSMLSDKDKLQEFADEREVDFAYAIDGTGRFRVNAFHQRGAVSLVCRAILLIDPPSIDANEITDKGYINQRAVLQRRADLVERLYAEPPDGFVIAASS